MSVGPFLYDGNRVEKSNGTIFWYGAGTEILDESNSSGTFTNEYVFFSGKRIAMRNVSSGNIYYYEDDMLGSSRTMVQAGQTSVCYDADFYPFGGERDITNTCTQNYKFEGKIRDAESGLDDFGARYYSSTIGRFMSADWSAVPAPVPYANLTNPQTLNLYAMVSDNPETFADLDGHTIQGGPYNLETGDFSGGQDGQGHQCDYVGNDCSQNTNVNGDENAGIPDWYLSEASGQQNNGPQAQQQDKWVNPTGGKVRGCDAGGCGSYGAPRNEGLGPTHQGTDYVAKPGQDVVAVHDGTVTRVGYAYKGDTRLRSVDIKTSDGYRITVLYVAPSSGVKAGTKVTAGQVIGTAQDVRVRVGPKVTPHVHVTIRRGAEHVNPETLIPVPKE